MVALSAAAVKGSEAERGDGEQTKGWRFRHCCRHRRYRHIVKQPTGGTSCGKIEGRARGRRRHCEILEHVSGRRYIHQIKHLIAAEGGGELKSV